MSSQHGENPLRKNRRELLRFGGILALPLLAGCLGSGEDDDDDEDEPEETDDETDDDEDNEDEEDEPEETDDETDDDEDEPEEIDDEDEEDPDPAEADYRLGGDAVDGWVGIAPESIADETNPTLNLSAGEEYIVAWENLDGRPHNFAIEDEDEDNFVETEIMDDQNETQIATFTAEAGMASYYCVPHPSTMRGEVNIND